MPYVRSQPQIYAFFRQQSTVFCSIFLSIYSCRWSYSNLPNDTIVIHVGAVAAAAPTPVPTLREYGVMALASLVAMGGLWATRRRRM
jgi:hypothetical protein